MSLFDNFPSETGAYRNYGQLVTVTLADGSEVQGTIRWEDDKGAKVDLPGEDVGTFVAHEFLTR